MKKNKVLILSAIALFATLGFSSCIKEEVDVEKPVITIHEPAPHDVLTIGKDVHFDMELSDNAGLSSYKVNIHANFDGHHHAPRKAPAATAANDSAAFEMTKIWTDIAGQKSANIHHHEIVIPKEIDGKPVKTGNYHFIVYALDKAGNESYSAVDVVLSYSESGSHEH